MGWHDDDAVPLRIEACIDRRAARVALTGELDAERADEVVAVVRVAAAPGRSLTIDLTGLTFIDSTGSTALLDARRIARGTGAAPVRVTGDPDGPVSRVLRLSGTDRALELEWVVPR